MMDLPDQLLARTMVLLIDYAIADEPRPIEMKHKLQDALVEWEKRAAQDDMLAVALAPFLRP